MTTDPGTMYGVWRPHIRFGLSGLPMKSQGGRAHAWHGELMTCQGSERQTLRYSSFISKIWRMKYVSRTACNPSLGGFMQMVLRVSQDA